MLTNLESRELSILEKISRPPVEWDAMNSEFTQQYRVDLIRDLESLIQRASMLSGYLEMRYGSGCGDQGHDDAVKESNRRLKAVRKALGFTYPAKGCISF